MAANWLPKWMLTITSAFGSRQQVLLRKFYNAMPKDRHTCAFMKSLRLSEGFPIAIDVMTLKFNPVDVEQTIWPLEPTPGEDISNCTDGSSPYSTSYFILKQTK